jgi:cytochrome c-type biogenesis protein CcmF
MARRHRAVAFRGRDGEAQRAESLTILLSILTFSLSLLGTPVRSGVLTSVHAFATDPTRGVLSFDPVPFIGGSLALYAWRASALKQGGMLVLISRAKARWCSTICSSPRPARRCSSARSIRWRWKF